MTPSFGIICAYLFIRLIKHFLDTDYSSSETKIKEPASQIPVPKTPMAISYKVLELPVKMPVSVDVIKRAYFKQLEFAAEDKALGYTPKHTIKQYQAAREYLFDFCAYAAFKN